MDIEFTKLNIFTKIRNFLIAEPGLLEKALDILVKVARTVCRKIRISG